MFLPLKAVKAYSPSSLLEAGHFRVAILIYAISRSPFWVIWLAAIQPKNVEEIQPPVSSWEQGVIFLFCESHEERTEVERILRTKSQQARAVWFGAKFTRGGVTQPVA